jgi:hypothetical protein
LENGSTLLAVAALAVLLLGFGAVVAALRGAPSAQVGARAWAAPAGSGAGLAWALATLGLALLPLLLVALGASGATLWRACSAVAGLVVPALVAWTWLAGRGLPRGAAPPALSALVGPADAAAVVLALASLANAGQVFHPVAPGPYVAAVLWLLLASALRFLASAR